MFNWFIKLFRKNKTNESGFTKTKSFTDTEIDKIVKIQNTQYDRRRKLSDIDLLVITERINKGENIKSIANDYNVDYRTIKYYVDPTYRKIRIKQSYTNNPTKYTSEQKLNMKINRINYKKSLIDNNLMNV